MSQSRSSASQYFDILVVGGGPVGAAFACALDGTGLSVGVVDRVGSPAGQAPEEQRAGPAGVALYDARVSAISPASRSMLESLGAWEAVEKRCCPYTNMHVWEADGTASIHFDAADVRAEALGYIVENSVLLEGLHRQLSQQQVTHIQGGVASLQPALAGEVPGQAVILEDGRRFTTRLIVGADGTQSIVRQLGQFPVREWDYDHHAIVTTVRTARPHRATAIQRFMDSGILAFLPLPDIAEAAGDNAAHQRHCSIVWSVVPEEAERLLAMTDAEFLSALEHAIEGHLGPIEWADRRFSFPLRQRHATTYVQSQRALIGDAAHSIHPLAGLGVNLGFLDAWSLARHIRKALDQQRDFASLQVLQRYERERRSNNLQVMWLMEGFKRLFADQPPALRWLRNTGMRGVDSLPLLKNQIMRHAMGMPLPKHSARNPSSINSARR